MFVRFANAFVALPGGLGTFDELFEALCLIQTEKIRLARDPHRPGLWSGLMAWLRDTAAAEGRIRSRTSTCSW